VGLSIVNVTAFEVPPPGAGVTTVTEAVPPVARSAGGIVACNSVLETKEVARSLLFHSTVEEATKLEPETVSVNVLIAPSNAVFGPIEDISGIGF
jgi:hypothetical protein